MDKKKVILGGLFLILNFGALGLGSFLMGDSPIANEWYQSLNKAPWTPPGWVFGAAWTSIMICLTIALARHFYLHKSPQFTIVFIVQWVLNVSWNYFFFNLHDPVTGLIIITGLTLIVAYMMFVVGKQNILNAILISPYVIWLCIATSLNLYAVLYN